MIVPEQSFLDKRFDTFPVFEKQIPGMIPVEESIYNIADTSTSWHGPWLSEPASLALIMILACLSIVYVSILTYLIFKRQEMQPLKIKSPRLMGLSIFANLFIIIQVSIIQLQEETCVNVEDPTDVPICYKGILYTASIALGFIVIGFTEPLAIISYVLRAFRLRRIYDAQLTYFREERKPVEMIEKFRELRLIKIVAISVGVIAIVYLLIAVCFAFIPDENHLYLLPSIDTASFTQGQINEDNG